MGLGGSGDGGAAAQEAARQASITQGEGQINQDFAGFTPAFYQQAATDYTNAQTPELFSDYQNTRNNLAYSLARGGNTNSSTAVNRNQSLQDTLSQNESTIANNAQNQSNTLQANVNTQKGNLVNQLEASGDPTAINEQAVSAASQLRAPSAIQPLGNLFSDWSQQYLGNQQAQSENNSSVLNELLNNGYGTVGSGGGSSYLVG